MTLDLKILLDHGGDGFCGHLKDNLTETTEVVKWKEGSCRERRSAPPAFMEREGGHRGPLSQDIPA